MMEYVLRRARARYRIADEPQAGALGGWVVDPFWPMLATMLAGSWLGVPWFAANAVALGSATRRREIALAAVSVAGAAALTVALIAANNGGLLPVRAARYGVVLVTAWRLMTAYAVYQLQDASFELHRHFGGRARNGAPLAVLGAFLPLDRLLGAAAGLFHVVLG